MLYNCAMELPFFQVDAFATEPFTGNPAVVYRLDAWLDDALMQRIAQEHNLSETAFVVPSGAAWQIRWFTPSTEVPLCGHATLASAYVLFEKYGQKGEHIRFLSQSGELSVSRTEKGMLALDFPAYPPQEIKPDPALAQALGVFPAGFYAAGKTLVLLESEQQVLDCKPDFVALSTMHPHGVIITAPGSRHDFVSRYFAPTLGVDEDPVTGSAHCQLIPFWAQRLGKDRLHAWQCSARGGELACQLLGSRVSIAGHARLMAKGHLLL